MMPPSQSEHPRYMAYEEQHPTNPPKSLGWVVWDTEGGALGKGQIVEPVDDHVGLDRERARGIADMLNESSHQLNVDDEREHREYEQIREWEDER